jgi:hypothetical protein
MTERLKKEIDYLRDAKNNLWTATLGTFGGSFGLIFVNISLAVKLPIVITGLLISAIFLDNYFKKGDMIERRINFLKEKGE